MDSNDRERVGEAREELMRMLAEDELRDAVLLVFANKQVYNIQIVTEVEVTIGNFFPEVQVGEMSPDAKDRVIFPQLRGNNFQ